MEITVTKLSDSEHRITVQRADGSQESKTLNSRSFLFHDIAHLAVEKVLPIRAGFWGSVAQGARLDSSDCDGADVSLAESLAGPIQVLIKRDAAITAYQQVLARVLPEHQGLPELAAQIHEEARKLKGQWRATPYGDSMTLHWS